MSGHFCIWSRGTLLGSERRFSEPKDVSPSAQVASRLIQGVPSTGQSASPVAQGESHPWKTRSCGWGDRGCCPVESGSRAPTGESVGRAIEVARRHDRSRTARRGRTHGRTGRVFVLRITDLMVVRVGSIGRWRRIALLDEAGPTVVRISVHVRSRGRLVCMERRVVCAEKRLVGPRERSCARDRVDSCAHAIRGHLA